ncbi:hypothetical protein AMTR_s00001p00129390 [Amborella trichopoda]|uniref:imidazoleglycerol-phosphate dehydratase n=1 Tax=Amborella trichopoda TaxID=13333 RepID=W1NL41_AMBTC|nr:hypothetical protein AMTR_s00001p00129390 [Amborella trichopoda]
MRVVSALKLLGVSEGDEILRANTSILAACKDDQEASAQKQAFRFICCAATKARDNGSPIMTPKACRIGEVRRVTKETNVHVKINLDGSGFADNNTGIPFLDHMLDQLASHGPFDVCVKAQGDIHIDDHHTNEDVALAIGTTLLQALGDRKGVNRFGDFSAPLDEALVHVALMRCEIWITI